MVVAIASGGDRRARACYRERAGKGRVSRESGRRTRGLGGVTRRSVEDGGGSRRWKEEVASGARGGDTPLPSGRGGRRLAGRLVGWASYSAGPHRWAAGNRGKSSLSFISVFLFICSVLI